MTPNIAERVEEIQKRSLGRSTTKDQIRFDNLGTILASQDVPFLLDLIGKYQKIVKTVDDFIAPVPRGFSPRFEWEEIKKESGLFGEGE